MSKTIRNLSVIFDEVKGREGYYGTARYYGGKTYYLKKNNYYHGDYFEERYICAVSKKNIKRGTLGVPLYYCNSLIYIFAEKSKSQVM